MKPKHFVSRAIRHFFVFLCVVVFGVLVLGHAAAAPFALHSPVVADGGALPKEYTGDGSGSTLPLVWENAPAETTSFALIMHHVDVEGKTKWYWTLYHIPVDTQGLPKNAKGIGTLGTNSINDRTEYAPPHSKGPGAKTYTLTLYALSSVPQVAVAPSAVTRDLLLAAMKDHILATAELHVVYTRGKDE